MKPELFVSGTFAVPQGEYIQPRRYPSVLETGNVLIGQSDPVLAHAWALRNYDADVSFSLGQMRFEDGHTITYLITRDRQSFLDSLHRTDAGQYGGFIHKVDAEVFSLSSDRVGQNKWLSQQPTRVTAPPTFVSLEEAMAQGIQVYVLEDQAFIKTLVEGRKQHPIIIREGLNSGALSCMNEAYGFARLDLPVSNTSSPGTATGSDHSLEPAPPKPFRRAGGKPAAQS